MKGLIAKLNGWIRWRATRVLGAVALVSLLAATAEFSILAKREGQLVDRFSDSSWWMASQFRAEIQQLHISLATFDGSAAGLDDVHDHYEIVLSRIGTLEDAQLEPKPDPAFMKAFADVRDRMIALGAKIDAIKPGDTAAAAALEPVLRKIELAAGRMTTMGAQDDAVHRGAVRMAIDHANVAFGLTELLLIVSLLLTIRAVVRQAARLDAARLRSEALSGELTVALAQAQAGARAKSAFLATMSHEIRTPMNGVLGAASLLSHTALTDSQRRWVEIVKACGGTLLAQLDDVLDFSALEAEAVPLLREPIGLRTLAQSTAEVVEGAAAEKGLDLVVVIDPDVPATLLSDRRRLGQVLLNLLSNAVKFTPDGGVLLRVSLRRRGAATWLRVAVADTGPGIPRADRRRIFEEFSRLDRPNERTVRGTGLGLAISRRIAHALGGALRVTSAVGGGSLFWLTVPVGLPEDATITPPPSYAGTVAIVVGTALIRAGLTQLLQAEGYRVVTTPSGPVDLLMLHTTVAATTIAHRRRLSFGPGSELDAPLSQARLHAALRGGAAPAPPPAVAPGFASAPLRLLVADDDAINREIAASLLEHLGHDVTTVEDGPEALAAAKTTLFDCVLLDLHMPGMDGAELARAIRQLPQPTATARLIAVTADADAATRDAAAAAGIDSMVIKPVTLERLAEALLPARRKFPPMPAAAPAPAPPIPNLQVIDIASRQALAARLSPERFTALVRTFWNGLVETLETPGSLAEGAGDRRLHSLSGSAASLGYLVVAAAAGYSRQKLKAGDDDTALPLLFAALRAALQADSGLLPPGFVGRATAALNGVDAGLAQAEPREAAS